MVVSVRLAAGETRLPGWDSMGIGVQLLLVGLLSDRLLQFLSKLKFALTLLVTSWTEKKQRLQSAGTLLAPNASLCPLLLSVVFLFAMISAPLLPLFTLPIFLWASLGLSIVGLGPWAPPASVQTPSTTSR